ncbi:MAG: bifunctional methylenetetrahydrofolate dehydrogenase/methenyltetrahydrofolate cyclohydrolase FolD [bacterium]
MTRKLRGKPVRDAILSDLSTKVAGMERPPGLGVVLIGDDPASEVYVSHKSKACEEVGFHQETHHFAKETSVAEVLSCLDHLNHDSRIDGILVQLPLPDHLDAERILLAVDPHKDVDGFHPENLGLLVAGRPRFIPCTPKGIVCLLRHYEIPIAGRHVAVVGRSLIVGRPLTLLLTLKGEDADATVTLCHSRTRDLAAVTRNADIVVAAVGSPALLGIEFIREGAVVIDVGINRIADPTAKTGTRLVGDVALEAVKDRAEAYTPVPGGVGPMTIAMLLQNTFEARTRTEPT